MRATYANCAWQDQLLGKSHHMAQYDYVDDHFAHQLLLLDFSGNPWPPEYRSGDGDRIPQLPFQYIETHDHRRLMMSVGGVGHAEESGFKLADRRRWYPQRRSRAGRCDRPSAAGVGERRDDRRR